MLKYIIVGSGGFLGAVTRYAVSGWITNWFGYRFPTGTFFVNVTGSFLLSLFLTLAVEKLLVGPQWRLFWAIGFLGAYTTFSTFSWESDALIREGAWYMALVNILANVFAGVLAVKIGMVLARIT